MTKEQEVLSKEDREKIPELRRQGLSYQKIANQFNPTVTRQRIEQICRTLDI